MGVSVTLKKGRVQFGLEDYFSAYFQDSTCKVNTSLYLFLGGVGTGKSRNAMEFPNTLISCPDKDSGLRGRLEKAEVFLVNLENGASILKEQRNLLPLGIIGTLMLLQLLPDEVGVNQVIQKYVSPDPTEVLRAVAQGEGEDLYNEFTGIIIIDGVQNFLQGSNSDQDKDSDLYQILVEIGELALQPCTKSVFVIPCCTTTIDLPPQFFITHRNRIYLPLKSLDDLDPPNTVKNGNL